MILSACVCVLVCSTGWIRANPELVWLEDVHGNHDLRHLDTALPNDLEFNLKRKGDRQINLQLQENRRLNANAPVYETIVEKGVQKAIKKDAKSITNVKFYQDKRTGAALKVSCDSRLGGAGSCRRVVEGSLNIDGDGYEIKPSPTHLTFRGFGINTNIPHIIEKVEAPPKPETGNFRGLFGARSKKIPTADKRGYEQDHKTIPDEPLVRSGVKVDHEDIPGELDIQEDLLDELRSLLLEEDIDERMKKMLNKKMLNKKRQKRESGNVYAVEVLIVVDPPLWKRYYALTSSSSSMDRDEATEYYMRVRLAHIINGVSLRYESIDDNDMNVYVTLSGFLFYKTIDSSNPLSPTVDIPVVNGVEYASSNSYIDKLDEWAMTLPSDLRNSDHIMVITGYELYYDGNTDNDGVAGVAYVGGACGRYGVSVQQDGGYFVLTNVAAHELGHNLGSDHDGDGSSTACPINDEFIMAPYIASFGSGDNYSVNPWRFSSCSIQAFKDFFGSGRCFMDHGDYYDNDEWDTHNENLPGELHSADAQCKLIRGDDSYLCSSPTAETVCRTMTCYNSDDGRCYYYVAARGTPCGATSLNKWCIDGECIERDAIVTTQPPTTQPPTTQPPTTQPPTTQPPTTQPPTTTTTQPPTTTTQPPTTTTQPPTTTTTQPPATTTTQPPTTTTTQPPTTTTTQPPTSTTTQPPTSTTTQPPNTTTTQPPTTTTTQPPTTTTTKPPATTTTQPPATTTTSMQTTVADTTCTNIGWYDWSCQMISDYFYDYYYFMPSYWCQDQFWATSCCLFCEAAQSSTTTSTTTFAPTTTEACVDYGYYQWSCRRLSGFFWATYSVTPRDWCRDPEWRSRCCEYCSNRGY